MITLKIKWQMMRKQDSEVLIENRFCPKILGNCIFSLLKQFAFLRRIKYILELCSHCEAQKWQKFAEFAKNTKNALIIFFF